MIASRLGVGIRKQGRPPGAIPEVGRRDRQRVIPRATGRWWPPAPRPAPLGLAQPRGSKSRRLFPLQETWSWEGEPLTEDHHERVAAVSNHGTIVLGTDDGLSYWVLAMTGSERGKVWLVTDVGAYPYPMPRALGFLEWVQRWHASDGWWD